MANNQKYFNVPILLFKGFMIDSKTVLSNVADYACYEFTEKQGCEFKDAESYYNIKFDKLKSSEINGKKLYNSIPINSPKVGLGLTMFWQFNNEDKTEFEKICLLAYLSIKSIVQSKAIYKMDNKFFLSRMDGNNNSIDEAKLSPEIKKYANEYQTVKIKRELRNNWGLVYYGRYTRGWYVSFSMSLESLIIQAERKRKSTLEKQYKEKEKEAVRMALQQLNATRT